VANRHIVQERDIAGEGEREVQGGARGEVVSEIMKDIDPWRQLRDETFEALWNEFYRKWRGFWAPEDKNTKSERSRLISPLTAMAVDLTVAEIVESVLGREYLVDLPDDVDDAEKADMERARLLLTEDLREEGFDLQFPMTALNGALYGTGLMKIQILTRTRKELQRDPKTKKLVVIPHEEVHIRPVAVEPSQFVGDPTATNIDDMKGCAHEFPLGLHTIQQRQQDGIYYDDVDIGPYSAWTTNGMQRADTEAGDRKKKGDAALITEYYGLINTRLFLRAVAEGKGQEIPPEELLRVPRNSMTEVIATIANKTHLLRIIENPNATGERLFVAYQHESVPARFWGRGVAEKAANVQRAMDAEMRARIDSLAWSNTRMFAGDLTRLPPGTNLNAWPGKFWGTRGNPNEVIQELKFSGPDPSSFNHMADLERMGQQATGALDSIMSLRAGVRDETATGSAMSAAGFIKRSKRTMRNIEAFLNTLMRRIVHVKMKFDSERYPTDFKFQVKGTLGMMAREMEQQHLTQLLHNLGGDSPYAGLLLQAIVQHSSIPNREAIVKAIEAQINRKPTPEEEAARRATLLLPVAEFEKTQAETAKLLSEAGLKEAQTVTEMAEAADVPVQSQIKVVEVANDLEETRNQVRQLDLLEEKNDIERQKLKIQARKSNSK